MYTIRHLKKDTTVLVMEKALCVALLQEIIQRYGCDFSFSALLLEESKKGYVIKIRSCNVTDELRVCMVDVASRHGVGLKQEGEYLTICDVELVALP